MPQLDIFSFFPQLFWGFLFFFFYFFFVSFYILPSLAASIKFKKKQFLFLSTVVLKNRNPMNSSNVSDHFLALSFKEMEKLIVSCSNYFDFWNKKVQLQILANPLLIVNREYLVKSFPFYNSRVLKFETFLARKLFPKLIVKNVKKRKTF